MNGPQMGQKEIGVRSSGLRDLHQFAHSKTGDCMIAENDLPGVQL